MYLSKLLKTDLTIVENEAGGQILNLISNDASKFEYCLLFLPYIFIGPLLIIAAIGIMAWLIDPTFLTGFGLIAVVLVLQIVLTKFTQRFRTTSAKKCDKRIGMLDEIFGGIKVVKMYCWETPYNNLLKHLRK